MSKEIVFVHSKVKSGFSEKLCEFLGVKEADTPIVFIIQLLEGQIKKFKLTEPISEDSLKNMIKKYKEGSLEAH